MSLDLKQPIDTCLQRIANVLLLKASFIDNLGLLNGKMGIAIFFFHYGKYTNNDIHLRYGGELVDEIFDELNSKAPIGFINGLAGICWGVEYLVQNRFIEVDTDAMLEKMDYAIYRAIQNQPILMENKTDLFGFGLYYLSRLRGRENDDENLYTLIKKQQLIYLTDECERLLVHKRFLEFNIPTLNIATLNSIAFFLLEMHKLALFPSKVEKLFRYLFSYLDFCLYKETDWAEKNTLLILVQSIQVLVPDIDLQQQYASLANRIITEHPATMSEQMHEAVIGCFVKSSLHHLIYAPYSTKIGYKHIHLERVSAIIADEVNWNQQLKKLNKNNMGLTGLTGIGLGLLLNEGE